uniref:RNA-directed DNA polymerase, eukaryota, reverse transcriptase zinc-binding domain protein n=1 Tax=Tanacetum cinerariifolium TaxID=118510 RepID=A0A6L2JHN4_TANCI|nr:RNA-directed DNA polymerase, eukaryota, reverse transcriptase zinc-binding domain protein [Tanacetum cinerariifolium]
MTSLADKAILSGTDNRPPMLEKDMYDSSKRRMELYILNRKHGRMILESVENGPLLWPIVEENGVTRLKKYFELSTTEAIQADYPFVLVAHHQMNKSTYQPHQQSYHQHQFPPQVSPFQSSPYEPQYHSSQYASQASSSTPLLLTYPSNDFHSSVNHNVYNASSLIPQMEYAPTVHQQTEFSLPDTGLIVLVFQKGDDPIDAINQMMSFLTSVVTSWYPPTNNQLRTSSNPCQQATINIGRVTIQLIQGRQNSMTACSSRPYTSGSIRTSRKHRVIVCYNCKGEGHMSKQCTKPKRKKDEQWFKDKVLLVQVQANGQVLQEEELEFLADPRIAKTLKLEAHYMYMAQLQEVTPDTSDNSGPIFDTEPLQKLPNNDNYNVFAIKNEHPEQSKPINDTYPIEQDEHNVIIDSLDMSYDREQVDQDDDDDLANERDLLASLIEKLKCEIDDSKNRTKFLETSNKALVDKLKDEIKDFKTKNKSLESSNNHFKEANNELSKTSQLMFKDLKKFQAELNRYHDVKYASKVAIDCAKAKGDLMSYKMVSEKSFNEYNRKINDLNQTISEMKKELFAHQKTISIMSQEKEAQFKFYKTREDKKNDKVIALENKVKVLDNIVYKTGQSVQTMKKMMQVRIMMVIDGNLSWNQCCSQVYEDLIMDGSGLKTGKTSTLGSQTFKLLILQISLIKLYRWITMAMKSTQQILFGKIGNHGKVHWYNIVWHSNCIPKHTFLLWIAARNKLCTQDRMGKWYPNKVWKMVCNIAKLNLKEDKWDNILEEMSKDKDNNSIWGVIRRLCLAAAVYFIWQELNRRLFINCSRDELELFKAICEELKAKRVSIQVKQSNQVLQAEVV